MLCAKVPRWPRGTSRRGTAYRTFKHGKMLVQRTCFLSTLASQGCKDAYAACDHRLDSLGFVSTSEIVRQINHRDIAEAKSSSPAPSTAVPPVEVAAHNHRHQQLERTTL
eukprot:1147659-Pelagomonas_calceolata.AAC.7